MPRETVGYARDRVRRVVHALLDLCKVEFVHHGTLPDRVRGLYGPDNGQNAGQGPAIMVANLERWTYRLTLLLPCTHILATSLQCCRHVNQWRVKFRRSGTSFRTINRPRR